LNLIGKDTIVWRFDNRRVVYGDKCLMSIMERLINNEELKIS